jgi:membrane dipeptidase
MLIVDAHEDFAWSSLTFSRDYCLSTKQIRDQAYNNGALEGTGDCMFGWPDYQQGQIALIFATLFASPLRCVTDAWDTIHYADQKQAAKLYHRQLDFYRRLVDDHPDKFTLIQMKDDLKELLSTWKIPPQMSEATGEWLHNNPVGLLILMESADPIHRLEELEQWWANGVRIIGPAWAGTVYCGGTNEPGSLTRAGIGLLERMGELGFGLDLSHMDEPAALQSLDIYPAQVFVTHGNVSRLLPGIESNRHISDRLIRGILEREGVIGVVGYNPFLIPGWSRGDPRSLVPIDRIVDHIDAICQIAGDASHVGIGSDFDGDLGALTVPQGIDSIADLRKLIPLLLERGYSDMDCRAIMGGNWLRITQSILPETS